MAYKLQDPQWCLKQADAVGPYTKLLIERLFAHRVLDNLNAAQGVIRLGKRFGHTRLEAACRRALAFDNPRYRAVKQILDKGLDQSTDQHSLFDELADRYTGSGRFCRGILIRIFRTVGHEDIEIRRCLVDCNAHVIDHIDDILDLLRVHDIVR